MDSLVVVGPQEDGLGLGVAHLHFGAKLLESAEDLQVQPLVDLALGVGLVEYLVDE